MSDTGNNNGGNDNGNENDDDEAARLLDDAVNAKTFTQEQVDKIVQERALREVRSKYGDYDDLKAKAAKFDDLEAANQSELEKTVARAEAAEKAAAAAAERARQSDLRSAVTAAASAAGAVDVDAVLALLSRDAVTIDDDGQVTGADEAVKALLESKPYLVGKTTKTGSADGGTRGSGDGPRQLSRDELSSMSPKQIVEAKKQGQLRDALGQT